MKRWIALLLALTLLTGCGINGQEGEPSEATPPGLTEPVNTTQTEPVPTQTEPLPTEPVSVFVENRTPVLGQDNLFYLPCEAVETMESPEIFFIGECMVLCSFCFDENFENTSYEVKSVNLMDGSVQAQFTLECSGYTTVSVKGERLVFTDSTVGQIRIYNAWLEEEQCIQLTPDEKAEEDWQLSNDLSRLYKLGWETGMTVVDLNTREETPALTDVSELLLYNWDGDDMILSFVDRGTQKECMARYSTLSAELEKLEPGVPGSWFKLYGDSMFANDYDSWFHFFLKQGENTVHFYDREGSVSMLEDGRLLIASDSANTLKLYSSDGSFLSGCSLEDTAYIGYVLPQWCDVLGGYLMVVPVEEAGSCLHLWDISAGVEGENLPVLPYSPEPSGGYTADRELYRRAEEISREYGVDIRIADQCALDYDEYYGYAVTDNESLTNGLDQLEKALSKYPEGFFDQLLYGRLKSIRIEFIGGLEKKDMPADAAYTSFSAFAQERGDHYLVVVDVEFAYEDTYYHEFSHIIDKRLAYDADLREGALYSEETWLSLQPKGFDYSYSYDYLPEDVGSARYDGWFVDYYSCTYPTEDRARLMEYAMAEFYWPFEGDTPIDDKLTYYSQCIRDCFDTTGWPEKTVWEMAIDQ